MRPGRAVIDYGEPQHCVSALSTEYGDNNKIFIQTGRRNKWRRDELHDRTSLSIKGPFFFDYFVIIKTLLARKLKFGRILYI